MPDSALQILPHQGLNHSLLLAILIGILILLLFTETLGWVYVGLVVPGYLSSVFANQATMGVAIIFEAIITYMLVRFLSDILARTTVWSPFFGRERFFLIVIVSIIVRQNSQIWLLPMTIDWTNHTFGTDYVFEEGAFSSIGVVLVPLVANMFWKINLWRGVGQVGIPVALTYVLIKHVLLPYTNLDYSKLDVFLHDVALNFLGTPKVYVILLISALLAARFNVLYGWDYNGILVPSLLALGWLEPVIIALTIGEVLVLYTVTRLVLATPMLRTANLEGPRQIALVFTLSFGVKYLVSWLLSEHMPTVNVLEIFGYGYVITSLMTVKILQKKTIGRVLLPTMTVSIIGFVAGSMAGWAFDQAWPRQRLINPSSDVAEMRPTETLGRDVLGVAMLATVRTLPATLPEHRQGRPAADLARYAELWRDIDRWLADPTDARQQRVERALVGFERSVEARKRYTDDEFEPEATHSALVMSQIQSPWRGQLAYRLIEREERLSKLTGWDNAVLLPGAPGPIIMVPRPLTEALTSDAAAVMCKNIKCRAILLSGVDSADDGATAGDALGHPRSSLFIAAQALVSSPIVQLRTYGVARPDGHAAPVYQPARVVRMYLKHKIPDQIDLGELWPINVDELELIWDQPPGRNQHWDARPDLVVLRAHRDALAGLLRADAQGTTGAVPVAPDATLQSWLDEVFDSPMGLAATQSLPSQSEVRFIEHVLAARLLARRANENAWVHHLAGLIDYRVTFLPSCGRDASCYILSEQHRPVRYRWGTLVVRDRRPGAAELPSRAPWLAVEVPRPIIEGGTRRLAMDMWQQTGAIAMLLGHDIPAAHGAPVLDPVRYGNVTTPFQAMHTSVHRKLATRPGSMIAQVRGFGTWRGIDKHLVIGLRAPTLQSSQIPEQITRMLDPGGFLAWLKPHSQFVNGDSAYISLAGQDNPQRAFTSRTGTVDMALLWFSQPVRQQYLSTARSRDRSRMEAAGLMMTEREALDVLLGELTPGQGIQPAGPDAPEFDELVKLAETYAITEDIHVLSALRRRAEQSESLQLAAYWSPNLYLPYLAIFGDDAGHRRRAVVLLTDLVDECAGLSAPARVSRDALSVALATRCRVITAEYTPEAE